MIPSSSSAHHLKNTLAAIIDTYEPSVSRKGLLNMAAFAAPTPWTMDRFLFGLRTWVDIVEGSINMPRWSKRYIPIPRHVWVIPQFASTKEDSSTISNTKKLRSIYSSVGAELLPTFWGKQTIITHLSVYQSMITSSVLTMTTWS